VWKRKLEHHAYAYAYAVKDTNKSNNNMDGWYEIKFKVKEEQMELLEGSFIGRLHNYDFYGIN